MENLNVIFLAKALSVPAFLLLLVGIVIAATIVFTLIYSGAEKSKEIAEKVKVKIEQKKQENKLKESIQTDLLEYQEFKNSFQYFSDEKLLNIYEQFQNGIKSSNMEQLALEEELVKRKMIDHSPMHEKLYAINKELF